MADDPDSMQADAARRLRSRRRIRAGSWIGLLIAVGLVLFASRHLAGRVANPVADARSWRGDTVELIDEPGADQAPSSPQLRAVGDLDRPIALRSGDVVHVETLQLPADAVTLELGLGEASKDAAPRPVRVYFGGRVVRELETRPLEGDLMQARVEIPSAVFGAPGLYMIEIETTEKAVMPIRRYAIELHGP